MISLEQKIKYMLYRKWWFNELFVGEMIDFEITKTITKDCEAVNGFKLIFKNIIVYAEGEDVYTFNFDNFSEAVDGNN